MKELDMEVVSVAGSDKTVGEGEGGDYERRGSNSKEVGVSGGV
jgi:hypothetical protein